MAKKPLVEMITIQALAKELNVTPGAVLDGLRRLFGGNTAQAAAIDPDTVQPQPDVPVDAITRATSRSTTGAAATANDKDGIRKVPQPKSKPQTPASTRPDALDMPAQGSKPQASAPAYADSEFDAGGTQGGTTRRVQQPSRTKEPAYANSEFDTGGTQGGTTRRVQQPSRSTTSNQNTNSTTTQTQNVLRTTAGQPVTSSSGAPVRTGSPVGDYPYQYIIDRAKKEIASGNLSNLDRLQRQATITNYENNKKKWTIKNYPKPGQEALAQLLKDADAAGREAVRLGKSGDQQGRMAAKKRQNTLNKRANSMLRTISDSVINSKPKIVDIAEEIKKLR